jgi:hypothetical protein
MSYKSLRRRHLPTANLSPPPGSSTARLWCQPRSRRCHFPACWHLNVVSTSAMVVSTGIAIRNTPRQCDNQPQPRGNALPLSRLREEDRCVFLFLPAWDTAFAAQLIHRIFQRHIGVFASNQEATIFRPHHHQHHHCYHQQHSCFIFSLSFWIFHLFIPIYSERASVFGGTLKSTQPPARSKAIFSTTTWLGPGGFLDCIYKHGRVSI